MGTYNQPPASCLREEAYSLHPLPLKQLQRRREGNECSEFPVLKSSETLEVSPAQNM